MLVRMIRSGQQHKLTSGPVDPANPAENGVPEPVVEPAYRVYGGDGSLLSAPGGLAGWPTTPRGLPYDPVSHVVRGDWLAPRCQSGAPYVPAWAPEPPDSSAQCPNQATRGLRVCMEHGGRANARMRVRAVQATLVEKLIDIALDDEQKTENQLRAIESLLDRGGELPKISVVAAPEVRQHLIERLLQYEAGSHELEAGGSAETASDLAL
jgi:hypothetical protein